MPAPPPGLDLPPPLPLHGTPGRRGPHQSLCSAPISPCPGHRSQTASSPGERGTERGGRTLHGGGERRSTPAFAVPSPSPPSLRSRHRTSPHSPVNMAPAALGWGLLGRGSWRWAEPPPRGPLQGAGLSQQGWGTGGGHRFVIISFVESTDFPVTGFRNTRVLGGARVCVSGEGGDRGHYGTQGRWAGRGGNRAGGC